MTTSPPPPVEVYGNIVTTPEGNVPIQGTVSVGNFPATQPISGSVAVSNLPATQPISGAVIVSNLPATQPIAPGQVSSYIFTNTNVLTASVLIASANPNRHGFIIFNNSSNSVYISYANPAVAANCVRLIATFTSWEHIYPFCYTGAIYAIRNSGTGACSVWEY